MQSKFWDLKDSDILRVNQNNEAIIDIKAAREKASMSQKQLAELLGIEQSTLSRHEQSPEDVPQKLLAKLQKLLGLRGQPSSTTGINISNPYEDMYTRLCLLEQYMNQADTKVDMSKLPEVPFEPRELEQIIRRYRQKPNVVLTGSFDTGKSHLANSLLGDNYLPAVYQPTTKIITFVRHIDDRPTWINEDVWIFSEEFWKNKNNEYIIDVELLNNKKKCEDCLLQAGTLDTLQQYGVHGGRNTKSAAHTAVVYLDSSVLKACNLVDFPGFSDMYENIPEDINNLTSAIKFADVVIYTSIARDYINGQDMSYIASLIHMLPNYDINNLEFPLLFNFFIVATYADPTIKDIEMNHIIDKASERLFKHLSGSLEQRLSGDSEQLCQVNPRKYTEEELKDELKKRLFTFWSEDQNRYESLFKELTNTLEKYLPSFYKSRLNAEIVSLKHTGKEKFSKSIESYQYIIKQQAFAKKYYKTLIEKEPSRLENISRSQQYISNLISLVKDESIKSFQRLAKDYLSVNKIESTIRNNFNQKDEAKKNAAEYILEKLKIFAEENIEKNSKRIIPEIESYIEYYGNQTRTVSPNNVDYMNIRFESGKAFLAGLSGKKPLSLGVLSNLVLTLGSINGQLEEETIRLISNAGIKVSAGLVPILYTIGLMSVPAVVLRSALTAGIALSTWNLISDSWQLRLAKKIKKLFDDVDIISQIVKCIENTWDETNEAFSIGAENLESVWKKYLEQQKEILFISVDSKAQMEYNIKEFDKLRDFFGGIPWRNIT